MSAYRGAREGINILLGLAFLLIAAAVVFYYPTGLALVKKASGKDEPILIPFILCALFIAGLLIAVITALVSWAVLHAFFDRADAALSSEALLTEENLARSAKPPTAAG